MEIITIYTRQEWNPQKNHELETTYKGYEIVNFMRGTKGGVQWLCPTLNCVSYTQKKNNNSHDYSWKIPGLSTEDHKLNHTNIHRYVPRAPTHEKVCVTWEPVVLHPGKSWRNGGEEAHSLRSREWNSVRPRVKVGQPRQIIHKDIILLFSGMGRVGHGEQDMWCSRNFHLGALQYISKMLAWHD